MVIRKLWGWNSSEKTRKKKGGRQGLRPWPLRCLSQFLSEKKRDCLEGECVANVCVCMSFCVPFMGWPCIYSRCSTSWMVIRSPSHWMEYFLFYSISDLVQDIERVIYLR